MPADDVHVVGDAGASWRVVLLHGHAGSPEALLGAAVDLAEAAPVQVVLPRGPVVAGDGWAWWVPGSPCPPEVAVTVRALVVADGRPTVLCGFSQGGAMALLACAGAPDGPRAGPAGLAVVAGFVPDDLEGRPRGPVPPPVLVLHGEDDEAVDPMHGRLVARWCERAGAPALDHVTYAAGHDWVPATTAAVVSWLGRLPRPASPDLRASSPGSPDGAG